MQYESNNNKTNKSIYAVLAICAVAVGLVIYLIVAKANVSEKDTESQKSEISSESSTYSSNEESVSEAPSEKSKVTENAVSDVPYDKKAGSDTPKKAEKQNFVMPVKGNIIKGFSDTSLQYDKTYGDLRMHKGIDISCEENAQIVSASKGTVTDIADTSEYGKVITIDHGNGLTVKYCGLGSVCVAKDDNIGVGVLIGTAKNPTCECMDECHIHIEAEKNGKAVSPVKAFGF